MTPKLTTWLGACAIALLLGICWDQPSDIQAMRDVAADKSEATKQTRRTMEIARRCYQERGVNSSWIETADGGYQCTDKKGRAGQKQVFAEVK